MKPGSKKTRPLITIVAGEDSMKKLCELASGMVIAPDLLVDYLCETDIESVIYGGNSRVIDFKSKRAFKGALEKLIKIRDRHCRHPSVCDVPARDCQIDHDNPWSQGGTTDQDNGQCMCPKHNRFKGTGPPTKAA